MRAVRIASVVAVSALLVGGLSACGSSGQKNAAPGTAASPGGGGAAGLPGGVDLGPKGELLAAAAVMQQVGSSKVAMSTTSGDGNGEGVYSWGGKPVIDLTQQQSGHAMRIRQVDGVMYLGTDDKSAAAVGGKHWIKLDGTGPAASAGNTLQGMVVMLDPAVQLAAAAKSGTLSKVGAEQVGGVNTQHYRSVMPVETLVASIPNLPDSVRQAVTDGLKGDGSSVTTDFWLDAKRQLVQQRETGSGGASASPSSGAGTSSDPMTVKYSDLGVKVDVAAPAAGDQMSSADALKVLGSLGG